MEEDQVTPHRRTSDDRHHHGDLAGEVEAPPVGAREGREVPAEQDPRPFIFSPKSFGTRAKSPIIAMHWSNKGSLKKTRNCRSTEPLQDTSRSPMEPMPIFYHLHFL